MTVVDAVLDILRLVPSHNLRTSAKHAYGTSSLHLILYLPAGRQLKSMVRS